jgi:hypothetical protein
MTGRGDGDAGHDHPVMASTTQPTDPRCCANCGGSSATSSCATYGIPERLPLTEEASQHPVNPYGYTKLLVERMLRDAEAAYGIRHVALRYFNAAGTDPDGELGELHLPETPRAVAG